MSLRKSFGNWARRWSVAGCVLTGLCGFSGLHAEETEPLPFDHMVPFIEQVIQREYYDPSRMQPAVMYQQAIRALESARIDIELTQEPDKLVAHFGTDVVELPITEPQTAADMWRSFQMLRSAIEARTEFTTSEARNLVYVMLNGALMALDPHTLIFPPEPASQFNEDIAGEFFGIGAYLSQEEGVVRIDRVMPGLPADQAGIEDGDKILYVDKETTAGLSLREAIRRIKGPKGTTVLLSVEREGAEGTIDIPVVRDRVAVVTMRGVRRDHVGYIMMTEFNRYTYRDLVALIQELDDRKNPLRGLVLDLRMNGGGMLQQAIQISDLFLGSRKEIVRTVRLDSRPNKRQASSRQVLKNIPMAVLISGQSASAAEILSGALQRHQRAVVLGQPSFGKGSVQILRPLPDESQVKLTIQEYQLAGGVSIQGVGVTPDLLLNRRRVSKTGQVDLLPFTGRHESDDEFALVGRNVLNYQSHGKLSWVQPYLDEDALRRSRLSNRDFQPDTEASMVVDMLNQAVSRDDFTALIGGNPMNMRDFTLDLMQPALEQRSAEEQEKLAAALASAPHPVIWGSGDAVQTATLAVEYIGPKAVEAGESASLSFRIKNSGERAAGRIYGVVSSDESSPFWEEEVIFGEVAAGESVEGFLDFTVPARWFAGTEHFDLHIFQDGSPELLAEVPVAIQVIEQPRPAFALSWKVADPAQSVEFDAPAVVHLDVENIGEGALGAAGVYVLKDDNPFVQLKEGRWHFENVGAGDSVRAAVPMTVKSHVDWAGGRDFPGGPITLQVQVVEDNPSEVGRIHRAALYQELELPVGAAVEGDRISPPLLKVIEQSVEAGRFRARLQIHDDNPEYVVIYHDDDKVALMPAPADGIIYLDRPLSADLNQIRVVVSDHDEAIGVRPFRVWNSSASSDETLTVRAQDKAEVVVP